MEPEKEGDERIPVGWVNKVIALLFAGWKESAPFTAKVTEALEKALNKDLPGFLGKVSVSELRMDGTAPEVLGMFPLGMQRGTEVRAFGL